MNRTGFPHGCPMLRLSSSGFLLFWLLLFGAPVLAQEGNRDYYAPRGPADTELLTAVEKYHLQPGYEKMSKKHYAAAFGDAKFMLHYFPNHPKALMLLFDVCSRWQSPTCNPDDWLDKAVSVNPSSSATHVIYGMHLHRTRRFEAAVKAYQQALEIDPNSLNAHYNLGLTYVEMKQYELANQHAQKSYALGAPFSGLRDRLKRAGFWKPLAETDAAPKSRDGDRSPGRQ